MRREHPREQTCTLAVLFRHHPDVSRVRHPVHGVHEGLQLHRARSDAAVGKHRELHLLVPSRCERAAVPH
eukprot:5647288-Prymnesium_polylepis.1